MNWAELFHRIQAIPASHVEWLMVEFEFVNTTRSRYYATMQFMDWCLRQGQIYHLMARVEEYS